MDISAPQALQINSFELSFLEVGVFGEFQKSHFIKTIILLYCCHTCTSYNFSVLLIK